MLNEQSQEAGLGIFLRDKEFFGSQTIPYLIPALIIDLIFS